jgi:hypothetical protein
VKSTSAETIILAFERIFSIHGIPEEVKTDNGTLFQSEVFAKFSEAKGFTHQKITPVWPEANRQVENFMKNIGKVAKTAHASGKDWRKEIYIFLSNYRVTPHPSTKKSPYGLMMNRVVRIKLPVIISGNSNPEVGINDESAKEKMKKYADNPRNTSKHSIVDGDAVLVRQQRRNKFSTPFESIPYIVEKVKGTMITARRTTDQRRITRNSSHYKKVRKPVQGNAPLEVILENEDEVSWNFETDLRNGSGSEREGNIRRTEISNQSEYTVEPLELRRSGHT